MKNRNRYDEARVSQYVVKEAEDSIQITAVWDALRLLFDEQAEAIGQL